MGIDIVRDNNQYDDQIRNVVTNAFKQENEADLIERIKNESHYYISYIALDNGKVVGHVMISPMYLNGSNDVLSLAPVSVLDSYNNQGIGSQLIKSAIGEAFNNKSYKLITVLGSDHYYSRFGFEGYDENKFNIPFEIESRFFQILEIEKGCLSELKGEFGYPDYFAI